MFDDKETLQAARRAGPKAGGTRRDQSGYFCTKAVVDQAAPTKAERRLSIKTRRQISRVLDAELPVLRVESGIMTARNDLA